MTFPPNQDTDYDCKEVGQTKAGFPLWKSMYVFTLLLNLLVTWSDSNWTPIKITPFRKMKLVENRNSHHDKEI